MREPIWITSTDVEIFHEDQHRQHGGLAGTRDIQALESALARPKNLLLYESSDLASLAAASAHGLVKNHPFNDGNKRAAFATAAVFLEVNGLEMTLSEEQATAMVLDLVANKISQEEFAQLLRRYTRKKPAIE